MNSNKNKELNELAIQLQNWQNTMRKCMTSEHAIHFSGFINGLLWAYKHGDLNIDHLDSQQFDKAFYDDKNKDMAYQQLKETLMQKSSFRSLLTWLATGIDSDDFPIQK